MSANIDSRKLYEPSCPFTYLRAGRLALLRVPPDEVGRALEDQFLVVVQRRDVVGVFEPERLSLSALATRLRMYSVLGGGTTWSSRATIASTGQVIRGNSSSVVLNSANNSLTSFPTPGTTAGGRP